jgi:hypothetical protein
MASIQIGSNDKLQVLADLIYLARHSPAGSEMQLRCLDLAAEVILKGEVRSSFSRRGKWRVWLQKDGKSRPEIAVRTARVPGSTLTRPNQ